MKVTIMYRNNYEGGDGWTYYPMMVNITDYCPICGRKRGEPKGYNFCEDGEWFHVDKWENSCRHIDKYKDVYFEAKLIKELEKRGYYNPYDVFNHPPEISKIDDPKYQYKISIMKWNTKSTRLVNLAARYDKTKKRFIISTYKQGSTKRIKHNEKMR